MPVDFIRDSVDDVEESEKAFFEQTPEKKFKFSWDKYNDAQKAGLVKKNKELLAAAATHKTAMARYEGFKDLTDDDLGEVTAWLEAGKPKGGSKPEEIEALKAQIGREWEKKLAKMTGEKDGLAKQIEAATKEIRHFKLTVPVRDAALKAGVLAEDIDLVLMDTSGKFGLTDDGKVAVLDADGDPTDTSLADFFGKLYKQQRPKFYAATGAGGSGAGHNTGGNAGAKTMARAQWAKLPPDQQAEFFKNKGTLTD